MADDPYSLLGLGSPEAEQVAQILGTQQPATRQVYGDPQAQSYSDYYDNIQADIDRRRRASEQANLLRYGGFPTATGQRARAEAYQKAIQQAVYEKQANALMTDLNALDPSDPEHLRHQDEVIAKHPVARQALSDPRISGLIKRQAHDFEEMQAVFNKDPAAMREYATLRAANVAPTTAKQKVLQQAQRRADRLWFASGGGDPAEFDAGKYNAPDGTFDKARAAYRLSQIKAEGKTKEEEKAKLLNSTERKLLDTLADEVAKQNPDNPQSKQTAFSAQKDKDPESEQDWSDAYEIVKKRREAKLDELRALIDDLEAGGKSIPENYRKMVAEGEGSSDEPGPPPPGAPVIDAAPRAGSSAAPSTPPSAQFSFPTPPPPTGMDPTTEIALGLRSPEVVVTYPTAPPQAARKPLPKGTGASAQLDRVLNAQKP